MSAVQDDPLIRDNITQYLDEYLDKELLRFVAIGSVDDGKSTLIGRLLHDTGMVFEDQLEAVRRATKMEDEEIDFSLFTDGLRAEREQGITIDVAYRYFTTKKRKFIIADTPGHVQYTRNMVTGASTADVALILIDARLGVLQQSRRHGYIASLLRIPNLAVCVNKMDLVGYDQGVFERIKADMLEFTDSLKAEGRGIDRVQFFPISALKGVNIVEGSSRTPWYDGPSVLSFLEDVPLGRTEDTRFRYPVQTVLRPHLDYRGFAGQIVSGTIKKGDRIVVLPAGTRSTVQGIDVYENELEEASSPQSICIRLEDEVDCSRGDMIVREGELPSVHRSFDADVVWMSEAPLDINKTYILKHTSQTVRVQVDEVRNKKDMDTLGDVDAERLELNDIGRLRLSTHRPIFHDPYSENRSTGAFILIDSLTNNTVASGMIRPEERDSELSLDDALKELRAGSGLSPRTQVSARERAARMGQRGNVIWMVGLPGSGRWSLAYALERHLFDLGRTATVVNPVGESFETMVSAAKACADAGLVCICAFPSYTAKDREILRERLGEDRVIAVYVNTDIELCKERRPDANFDGFEPPNNPDLTFTLDQLNLDSTVRFIVSELERRGMAAIP